MKCRECGCTDGRACPGGCVWAADALCSRCVEVAGLRRLKASYRSRATRWRKNADAAKSQDFIVRATAVASELDAVAADLEQLMDEGLRVRHLETVARINAGARHP